MSPLRSRLLPKKRTLSPSSLRILQEEAPVQLLEGLLDVAWLAERHQVVNGCKSDHGGLLSIIHVAFALHSSEDALGHFRGEVVL